MHQIYDAYYGDIFWAEKWPYSNELLYPDLLEVLGLTYQDIYYGTVGDRTYPRKLTASIDPNPGSIYFFLFQFQYSKDMLQTVLSLPTRHHVPDAGKNTYKIPTQDLFRVLQIVSQHENFTITIHGDVELNYNQVGQEDELTKSLASMDANDLVELQKTKELIAQSEVLSKNPDCKLWDFQVAGVAFMLHVWGALSGLVPGHRTIKTLDEVRGARDSKVSESLMKLKATIAKNKALKLVNS